MKKRHACTVAAHPTMVKIMQGMAEKINQAKQELDVANGELEFYVKQCATSLGLPPDTPFNRPDAVYELPEKDPEVS